MLVQWIYCTVLSLGSLPSLSLSSEMPVFCGVFVNSVMSVTNCSLKLQDVEIDDDFPGEMVLFCWKEERVKFYLVKPICY